MRKHDVLVVGAGFAGSVMAERIASRLGRRVLVVDRRDHIGGNAHDRVDDAGIRVHLYGPHLFHTKSRRVVQYLSRFTDWHPYEHRVLAEVAGRLVPIPINADTIEELYGLSLDEDGMERFLAERAERRRRITTGEDVVVSRVGRELYKAFFRGYSRKFWGRDPSRIAASVTGRIPVRTNRDDRYFTDWHQALPTDGYTAMFERMLDHPNIEVRLSTDFDDVRDEVEFGHLVYTGPIDDFYGRRFGPLPYRSLRFEWERVATPGGGLVQPVAQVNYPDEGRPFTRTTEFRHLYAQRAEVSTIAREFPTAVGEPYYPIPAPENQALYRRYARLAAADESISFVGRLARYQYLNMDQVVAQALVTFRRSAARIAASPRRAAAVPSGAS
jgi:UDP-galactopyranose mutase